MRGKGIELMVRLTAGVHPLPLELFRRAAGLLVCAYLLRLVWEAPELTLPGGLIDHQLSRELYWFTRLTLIPPDLPSAGLLALLAFDLLLAGCIVAGVRPRLSALGCFLVTVSLQRWNFLVYYVDDVAVQLLLFWLVLLPTEARTVTGASPPQSVETSPYGIVPGFRIRVFQANICLIYLVAGLTKLASPMWREGTALYAVLRLPVSRFPDFWRPEWLPALRVANHLAVAVEIAIPLLLLCAAHRKLRLAGLGLQLVFHVSILVTIGIPFANLALPAASILFFWRDIANRLDPQWQDTSQPLAPPGIADRFSIAYLLVLASSCLSRVELLRPIVVSAFSILWSVGLAQNYRLFDWIDSRNYHRSLQLSAWRADSNELPISPTRFLPHGVRYQLLEMNLYDMAWLPGSDRRLTDELKCSILTRTATRFCTNERFSGHVEVAAYLARTHPTNFDLGSVVRRPLVSFDCADGRLIRLDPQLSFSEPGFGAGCRS